jgi:transmembrane sensor
MTLLKQSSVNRTHSQPQACVLSGRTTTMPDRTPANVDADLQHAPAGKVARLRWMFALAAIIPVAGSSILLDPIPVKYYETASDKYWPVTCHNSVVSLEPQSRAAIQCTRYALRVRLLRGAALFRVQHDSSRSVVVLAGNAQVRDLGTVFSVHRYTDRTTVTVLEGAVQLSLLEKARHPVVGGPWASAADPVEEVTVWARERASVEDDMTSSHIASPERLTP